MNPLTERKVQQILGKKLFLRKICIPNVLMWRPHNTEYEADFIYFDLKTRYVTEVEIKTSMEDFRRDFQKDHHHDNCNVKYLYYAVPTELFTEHKDEILSAIGPNGLILITYKVRDNGVLIEQADFEKRAKARKAVIPLNQKKLEYFMKIGCMKWVSRYVEPISIRNDKKEG